MICLECKKREWQNKGPLKNKESGQVWKQAGDEKEENNTYQGPNTFFLSENSSECLPHAEPALEDLCHRSQQDTLQEEGSLGHNPDSKASAWNGDDFSVFQA